MHCRRCATENRQGAKFCDTCGTPLSSPCTVCGMVNRSGARFCDECGNTLEDLSAAEQATFPVSETPALQPERRQLTVLFCDVVGSTILSGKLEPEDFRDVMQAYQQVAAAVVQRFDGYVAQFLGDGLLIYFGYPHAHEDDAQRAVRAGLGILEALDVLNGHLQTHHGLTLAVRIGIHTGLVIVGSLGGGGFKQEQLALGETPNLAARLQNLAASHTVAISDATYHLVEGYFHCQPLGEQPLKGIAMPVMVYRVLGESGIQNRLEMSRSLTPLVGRDAEMAFLLERWEQVQAGQGQMVLLSGEAGIGKSRLIHALQERLGAANPTIIQCRCSPYFQHTPLYPVLATWKRNVHWDQNASNDAKLAKLERTLQEFGLPLETTVPLFATLLSLALPAERYTPLPLTPHQQKYRTLASLVHIWLELAVHRPVFFVMEDLHWVDPSTLELLTLLSEQAPTTRLFMLLTRRPEGQTPWRFAAHVTHLLLPRLPQQHVETVILQVAGGKVLPAEVVQQVVAKTDGIPLFVEELTKTVLESGRLREAPGHYILTGSLPTLAIPATLQDSLMARLDRLVTAKGIAQLGATIGRQFSYGLLHAISQLDEVTLQRELKRLVDHEILYQQGLPPHAEYIFKHALIQEAAYHTLIRSTRQQYHQRIAQQLEEHFPDMVASHPELLAHHYTEAHLGDQATAYWQRAGQQAMERSANLEAITHLNMALKVLRSLPVTPHRSERELELQTLVCVPLVATKSITSPEVGQAYQRAWELCQKVGNSAHRFPSLLGLYRFHTLRGEFQMAQQLEEQLLALAHQQQDPAHLIEVHRRLGVTRFHRGEFAAARWHCQQVSAYYKPHEHHPQVYIYGWVDAGVSVLGYEAYSLWNLGYPAQALERAQASLRLATELSHPLSLAFAHHFIARVHQHRREVAQVQAHAEQAIAISQEHAFAARRAAGLVLRGWAIAMQGQLTDGLMQVQQGIGEVAGMEAGVVTRAYFLALLAEVYAQQQQDEAALQCLDRAMESLPSEDYEAEVYRLRGDLLLGQGLMEEAETFFAQALIIARRQQARMPELRAALRMSRLWHRQGKREQARQCLFSLYHWFSEGFEIADLQEARGWVEALAG